MYYGNLNLVTVGFKYKSGLKKSKDTTSNWIRINLNKICIHLDLPTKESISAGTQKKHFYIFRKTSESIIVSRKCVK